MDLSELIGKLPAAEQEKLLEQVAQYKDALVREKAQKSFMAFVKEMWPGFIHGRHHALMAKKFEEIAAGKLKRLIINMPPRHTKSEFASYLLPAWFLGNNPTEEGNPDIEHGRTGGGVWTEGQEPSRQRSIWKNLPRSRTAELTRRPQGGGRLAMAAIILLLVLVVLLLVKALIYLLLTIHTSEQEARLAQGDPTVFDSVYEWYTSGPRQRLQPGGAIVVVMTRWSDKDLTGRVLKSDSTEWEVIELPAILPSGNSSLARVLVAGRADGTKRRASGRTNGTPSTSNSPPAKRVRW
jgi:hypothetical protein